MTDNRGWKKGKTRTHTDGQKLVIKNIRKKLENNIKELYIGPEKILKCIKKKQYIKDEKINLDSINHKFIQRTLKEFGLSKPHKKKVKGLSKYQCYPKILISKIGNRILEIDFLQRFIQGQTKPVHFIAFSCKSLKFRHYKRISAQTSLNTISAIKNFCDQFFIPDVIKMDNDLAFIGSNSAKRIISKTVQFLFSKHIIPLFTNPRNPWNNGSVEGSNSVFARNFWNKFIFNSINELDRKLNYFNQSSLEYSDYEYHDFKQKFYQDQKEFNPVIYFIRKVITDQENNDSGKINILNENIDLPNEYINLFTLSKWDLKTETLYIFFEKEQKEILIKKLKFQINKNCDFKI